MWQETRLILILCLLIIGIGQASASHKPKCQASSCYITLPRVVATTACAIPFKGYVRHGAANIQIQCKQLYSKVEPCQSVLAKNQRVVLLKNSHWIEVGRAWTNQHGEQVSNLSCPLLGFNTQATITYQCNAYCR